MVNSAEPLSLLSPVPFQTDGNKQKANCAPIEGGAGVHLTGWNVRLLQASLTDLDLSHERQTRKRKKTPLIFIQI